MDKLKQYSSILIRYFIGGGIFFWLFYTKQISIDILTACDIETLTWILCLTTFQFFLSSYRIKLLLGTHQIVVSLKKCMIYNSIGAFYSLLLPGAISGDAVKAYYFWRSGQDKKINKIDLLGVLITDRLIGTLVLIFIGLMAATYSAKLIGISSHYIVWTWITLIVGITVYLLLCLTHRLNWKFSQQSRMNKILPHLQRLFSKLDLSTYPKAIIALSIVLSVFIHLCTLLAIFLFAIRLQSGVYFNQVMVVGPIGLLVNAMPISPGGIGVGEKSFEVLFSIVGGQNGAETFMMSRIFLFAPAILGAIFAIIYRREKVEKSAHQDLEEFETS